MIDWAIACPGPAGLDVAMTALILAQVTVTPGALSSDPEQDAPVRAAVAVLLRACTAVVSIPFAAHLADAEALRRADPYQTPDELAHLAGAVALARSTQQAPAGPPAAA